MPKEPSKKMISVFEALARHTAPKCGQCLAAHACCNRAQCEDTRNFARQTFGIILEDTGEHLPFLGPTGCTVPPHLRPLCSVHVCEQHLRDDDWTERYFDLREQAGKELTKIMD